MGVGHRPYCHHKKATKNGRHPSYAEKSAYRGSAIAPIEIACGGISRLNGICVTRTSFPRIAATSQESSDEPLRKTPATGRGKQSDPRRNDRRRQVRLDVSGPGAAHSGHPSCRHSGYFAGEGEIQPGPGRMGGASIRGGEPRRGGDARHDLYRRGLARPRGAPANPDRDRMHGQSPGRRGAFPRCLRPGQARHQRDRRGGRVLRIGAGQEGTRRRGNLQHGLWRPAGACLRPGRLGAHLRFWRRGGGARA